MLPGPPFFPPFRRRVPPGWGCLPNFFRGAFFFSLPLVCGSFPCRRPDLVFSSHALPQTSFPRLFANRAGKFGLPPVLGNFSQRDSCELSGQDAGTFFLLFPCPNPPLFRSRFGCLTFPPFLARGLRDQAPLTLSFPMTLLVPFFFLARESSYFNRGATFFSGVSRAGIFESLPRKNPLSLSKVLSVQVHHNRKAPFMRGRGNVPLAIPSNPPRPLFSSPPSVCLSSLGQARSLLAVLFR